MEGVTDVKILNYWILRNEIGAEGGTSALWEIMINQKKEKVILMAQVNILT